MAPPTVHHPQHPLEHPAHRGNDPHHYRSYPHPSEHKKPQKTTHELLPYEESVLVIIKEATLAEMPLVAKLIKSTKLPPDINAIEKILLKWEKKLGKLGHPGGFGVTDFLHQQRLALKK